MSAGYAYWLGGQPQHGADVVAAALDLAPDPVVRADMQSLRGMALMFCQPVQDTYELLIDEAKRAEPHDVVRAATLLMQADMACAMSGQVARSIEIARWADRLAEPLGGQIAVQSAALVAFTVLMSGVEPRGLSPNGRADTETLVRSLMRVVETTDPLDPSGMLLLSAAAIRFSWLEDWATARATLERLIDAARRMSVVGSLPFSLAALSELELRQGRVTAAHAAAAESVQLARDTGQVVDASFSLATLARVQAILGLHEECRANVAAALDVSRRYGADSIEQYSSSVLGLLELSANHPERAVVHLDECAQHRERFACELPTVVPWQGDAIESMIRVGRHEDALRELARLEASGGGLRFVAVVAARCRGLLSEDEADYEARFAEALELGRDLSPLEQARTELCLGMRRRRSRRRSGARAAFRSALSTFESLGTEPWADQARAGLRSVGGRPTGSPGGTLRELTPQELQVALIVAEGTSNKEAAAALFLSPKTIEFHLSNVYRKLGLRSRTELVRRIASADGQEPGPQTQPSRAAGGRP